MFRRISRSVMVNLERIKEIHADPRGDHVLVLHSGQQLGLTRNVQEVMTWMQYPGEVRTEDRR
jgi:DNA-binding LytR/AlgR family response regulator